MCSQHFFMKLALKMVLDLICLVGYWESNQHTVFKMDVFSVDFHYSLYTVRFASFWPCYHCSFNSLFL